MASDDLDTLARLRGLLDVSRVVRDEESLPEVLNAVAGRAGWGQPAPEGRARGLAQIMGFGSYVAACAEVSVSPAGELTIRIDITGVYDLNR